MTATLQRIICVSSVAPLAVPVFAQTQNDFNRRIAGATNSLATQLGVGNVGDVKFIAGMTLPRNWLYCDGSAVSRLAFPQLWNELGAKWGAGDGISTFNLPPAGDLPVAATAPVTTITGASVAVAGSTPGGGAVGGTGGNTTTGGRPTDARGVRPA